MPKALTHAEKWKKRRSFVFNKYEGKCAYCGYDIRIDNFQIDHIVSKFEVQYYREKYNGFKYDDYENLNPACCSCNNFKRAHTLEDFRYEILCQIERLRRAKPTFRLAERYGLISCNPDNIIFHFEKLLNA